MARKRREISNRMLLVWLSLGGFILLLSPQKITGTLQGVFTHAFRFPLHLGRSITLSARVANTPGYADWRTDRQYENHIANLTAELEQKNRQIEELARIRYRQRALEGAALVIGDVITANLSGPHNELLINRGQSDFLQPGQFVLADNCIVGTITQVWPRQAKVRLISDSASRLPVKIAGLDNAVWMFGAGDGRAVIRWSKANPAVGHDVIAQEQPGFLDCPMIAGKVAGCERNDQNALLWDITVRPACDVQMLPSVVVIVMNPAE
jgi:cell shape-determining protein MreC